MSTTMNGPAETTTAHAWAAGLRELADFIEAHPEIDAAALDSFTVYAYCGTRDELADYARALGRADKGLDDYYRVVRRFGPHKIQAYTVREAVCERVVVGVETKVVREIPEEKGAEAERLRERLAALEVERQENVDIVEWRCDEPLLASKGGE